MKRLPILLVALLACPAIAAPLAQWNFNTDDGDHTTGTLTPVVGAGSLALIGGTTAFFAAGSPNDSPDFDLNSAWAVGNYPLQGTASGTAGFAGFVSTAGYQDISVTFDYHNQPSANKWFLLQASPDNGASWADVEIFDVAAADEWFTQTFNLSAVPGVNDNPLFGFRVVAVFAPPLPGTEYEASEAGYNPDFALDYDLLKVDANLVPEPATTAALVTGLFFLAVSIGLGRRSNNK